MTDEDARLDDGNRRGVADIAEKQYGDLLFYCSCDTSGFLWFLLWSGY